MHLELKSRIHKKKRRAAVSQIVVSEYTYVVEWTAVANNNHLEKEGGHEKKKSISFTSPRLMPAVVTAENIKRGSTAATHH